MGRMGTKTVKKSSRQVIERYYSRMTLDLQTNKKVLEEVALIPSKRLGNKIAGFSTHLMKRIQKGPVRGISLDMLAALGINDIPGLLQAHPVPVQHHHLLGFGRGAPRRY